jgi:hypothetical protein
MMHHPQNPKMSIQTLNIGSLWGYVTAVYLRCNTPLKVLHHHLTPIYDVYEVLRCLEHEKSFKILIYEGCSNCSCVGLKVLTHGFFERTTNYNHSNLGFRV